MNKKEAKAITGGLSKPSKMPGHAYNLPAWRCKTGVKLQAVAGSVCAGCYAMKGRYRFKNVKDALQRRMDSLDHPQWVQAMVVLIDKQPWFRWHDSGDIQSMKHLENMPNYIQIQRQVKLYLKCIRIKLVKVFQEQLSLE